MDKSKIYLDLSKCTEDEQKNIFSLLPERQEHLQYRINQYNKVLYLDNETDLWWVNGDTLPKNKTELTYPEFIKLFEGGEDTKTSLQIAVKALENIINPIGYMKSQLEEGETLNGYAAVMITEKPQFYQNIAKEALEKINSNQ